MADYDPATYHRQVWMTDDQWALARFVARIMGGFHHVCGKFKPAGYGIRIVLLNDGFSTIDRNRLTELVFAAHDEAIRVDLVNGSPGRVGLMLHKRKRVGSNWDAHPTLEDAVARWRSRNPEEAGHV